jgi:hypothetical protein
MKHVVLHEAGGTAKLPGVNPAPLNVFRNLNAFILLTSNSSRFFVELTSQDSLLGEA